MPQSRKNSRKHKTQMLRKFLRLLLNPLFYPYLAIYREGLSTSLESNVPESERGVGDAAGEGCIMIAGYLLYFIALNVAFHYLLKWGLGFDGALSYILVFFGLLFLSVVYLKLSGDEFKAVEKDYKAKKKARRRR